MPPLAQGLSLVWAVPFPFKCQNKAVRMASQCSQLWLSLSLENVRCCIVWHKRQLMLYRATRAFTQDLTASYHTILTSNNHKWQKNHLAQPCSLRHCVCWLKLVGKMFLNPEVYMCTIAWILNIEVIAASKLTHACRWQECPLVVVSLTTSFCCPLVVGYISTARNPRLQQALPDSELWCSKSCLSRGGEVSGMKGVFFLACTVLTGWVTE